MGINFSLQSKFMNQVILTIAQFPPLWKKKKEKKELKHTYSVWLISLPKDSKCYWEGEGALECPSPNSSPLHLAICGHLEVSVPPSSTLNGNKAKRQGWTSGIACCQSTYFCSVGWPHNSYHQNIHFLKDYISQGSRYLLKITVSPWGEWNQSWYLFSKPCYHWHTPRGVKERVEDGANDIPKREAMAGYQEAKVETDALLTKLVHVHK